MLHQRSLLGVISSAPGVLIRAFNREVDEPTIGKALALAGRVPVKVTSENGPIKIGDLLVAGSSPGYAMRYDPDGNNTIAPPNHSFAIIGTALEDFSGQSGTILAFVNLEHQRLTATSDLTGQLTIIDDTTSPTGQAVRLAGNAVFAGRLAAENGRWSLDQNGLLVVEKVKAKVVETEVVETKLGVTIEDRTTGQPYCVFVDGGVTKTEPGACDAPAQASASNPSSLTPGAANGSTTGTAASSTPSTPAPAIQLQPTNQPVSPPTTDSLTVPAEATTTPAPPQ